MAQTLQQFVLAIFGRKHYWRLSGCSMTRNRGVVVRFESVVILQKTNDFICVNNGNVLENIYTRPEAKGFDGRYRMSRQKCFSFTYRLIL